MKVLISLFFIYVTLYANIGTITLLKGEATIKRGSIILDAKMGDTIEKGDQIDTYKVSKMQLIFNDDTIVTLGANTKYIVDSYNDTNDLHMKMTLKRGFLKTITGRIGKLAPSKFKLKTKSATIGIRGTGWKTFVEANIENSVCFKGEITITTPTKFFELPAGNMILMSDGKAKKFKTDMKFFNKQIEKVQKKQKTKVKLKTVKSKEKEQKQKEKTEQKQEEKIEKKVEQKSKIIKVKNVEIQTTQKQEKIFSTPSETVEEHIDNSYIKQNDIVEEIISNPIVEVETIVDESIQVLKEDIEDEKIKSSMSISPFIIPVNIRKDEPIPSNGP